MESTFPSLNRTERVGPGSLGRFPRSLATIRRPHRGAVAQLDAGEDARRPCFPPHPLQRRREPLLPPQNCCAARP